MGTWGYGILQDDFAQDICDQYARAAAEGHSPDAIIAGLRTAHEAELAQVDVEAVFWLAIAHAQRDAAALQPDVVRRVTAMVDQGIGLGPWADAGIGELGRRKSALTRFLKSLAAARRPRVAPRRPATTPALPAFDVGDCLSVQLPDGTFCGVVVTRNKLDSTAPSLVVSVADARGPAPLDEKAFSPLKWLVLVPQQHPNLVVKYEVFAAGLASNRKRYRVVCRVRLDTVPEPLTFRLATWATLWKKLPDTLVVTA